MRRLPKMGDAYGGLNKRRARRCPACTASPEVGEPKMEEAEPTRAESSERTRPGTGGSSSDSSSSSSSCCCAGLAGLEDAGVSDALLSIEGRAYGVFLWIVDNGVGHSLLVVVGLDACT
jgi:hypothetical protein